MELYFSICIWMYLQVLIDSCLGCPASFPRLFQRENDIIKLTLKTTVNTQGVISYQIMKDRTNLMSIDFYNGEVMQQESCQPADCTFSGNAANGDFSITLSNVQRASAGTYKLIMMQTNDEKACATLFVLGSPDQPSLSSNKDPSIGESVIVTCSSTSTTTPKNHGLSLSYTWTIYGQTNPAGTRYTYSASGHQLTISIVQKTDNTIVLKCSATEVVTNGYTSSESLGFPFNVLYGPDSVSFSPAATSYEKALNSVLDPVTCQADCNGCSFSWSREHTTIVNTGVLSLKTLSVDKAGQYTCTASRTGAARRDKTLSIAVIHGPSSVSLIPADILYTVGIGRAIGTVTCSAHCWPCSYTWTGPGSFSSSEPTISLQGITNLSVGRYTCTATNERSSVSSYAYFDVNVLYGPDSITFNTSLSTIRQKEGSLFLPVECQSDCIGCTFTWNKDGVPLTRTAILDLATLHKSEAGVYSCTTSREGARSMNKQLEIQVIYGPDHVAVLPANTLYVLNDGNTMDSVVCSSDCFPECSLMWVPSLLSNQGNLSLGVLHKESTGVYTCVASNPEWSEKYVNVTITVRVRYGPDSALLNVASPFTVTEAEYIQSLECTSDCWPGCRLKWMNAANVTLQNTGTLALGKDAPDVFISQSITVWTENTPLDLLCKASGVPAVYNYTGFVQRVGAVVIPNSHAEHPGVKESISVNIPSLQLQDTGTYTCNVQNGITGVNKQLVQTASQRIDVRASPKFLVKECNFAGEPSGSIIIAIPFVSVPEYSSYSVLRHDGQPVSMNGKYTMHIKNDFVNAVFYGKQVTLVGNVLNMIITDLSEEEFGEYNIQITNDINTANFSINVMATSRPFPATELTIKSVNDTVTLEWKKGFNGGDEQTFVLQTSLNSEGVWMNRTTILESESKYVKNTGRYQVNLTNLAPGKYSARLVTLNSKGAADPITFKETFEVMELNTEATSRTNVVPVIGGSVAGIVTSLVLVIVILFVIRRKYTCVCSCKLAKREDLYKNTSNDQRMYTHGVAESGYNAAQTYEAISMTTNTQFYDALKNGDNGANNSDMLNEASAKPLPYYGNVKKGDTTL
ncbi:hemicentin-1-like isoform X2 [Mya arenaria]|uniref:hemicentin-1-like isoform X2 n=1 Tax=Mya arenaria TaxID=6604 RepID=UPI0022E35685|nr:hemicentin-1-like isoform X2 [Mya arenaria]